MNDRPLLTLAHGEPARFTPRFGQPLGVLWLAAVALLLWPLQRPAFAQDAQAAQSAKPSVREADLLAIRDRFGSAEPVSGSLEAFAQLAFSGPEFENHKVLAYEENRFFIYGMGTGRSLSLVRRVVFFKPAILAIDDRVDPEQAVAPSVWLIESNKAVSISPGQTPGGPVRCELHKQEGQTQLTIITPDRTFRLALAPDRLAAGNIEISSAQGETLLARRLLPSGVLPYGPQGVALLDRWDGAYRGGRRPGWDTGRPSSNLQKTVAEAAIRPCRAIELGCGTGTNAVWLAQQGFDVTALDIAPTALGLAAEKAAKAGVQIHCVLADVLAVPELGPFDFVFDRGCYHGVRRTGAAEYVASLERLTRPGSRVLILAGNANERTGSGPPRVKEEEIRADFSPHFEFEWLRETRFDTASAERQGALAWSILLRRKAAP